MTENEKAFKKIMDAIKQLKKDERKAIAEFEQKMKQFRLLEMEIILRLANKDLANMVFGKRDENGEKIKGEENDE